MKVLILGSASYAPTWWNEVGIDQYSADWEVATLNNAWAVVSPFPQTWWRSGDFDSVAKVRPRGEPNIVPMVVGQDDLQEPFTYDTPRDGAVFLNVAYHYLNRAVANEERLWVDVVGCDFVYRGTTHFYGAGTADPLRFGEAWLVDRLRDLGEAFRSTGNVIRNVGRQPDSLLPY